jgi:pantoate kinase
MPWSKSTAWSKTYRGTLGDVLARVLNGYNYVVRAREGSTVIIIIERVGSPPAVITPTQTPSLPENRTLRRSGA